MSGTVSRNEQPATRSSAIVVNDQRLSVSQDARPCTFEIRPSRARLGRDGGRGTVEVSTLTGCAWTASSNADWLRAVTTTGNGSGPMEYQVARNEGSARSATMTIGDQRFEVEQEAAPPPCTYSIRPTSRNVDAAGGEGRVDVETQSACEWSASAGASWVIVTRGSGTGNGSVVYIVQTNPSSSSRSTSISVAGQTHSISQAAATRACTYSIDPTSNTIAATGGNGAFLVSAESACLWSASSDAAWVIVRPGGNYGSGTAMVDYTVLPNISAGSRSARITVAGHSHTVTQNGLSTSVR